MQLGNWGRGKRFVKANEGLAIWIKRQQQMELDKKAKNDNIQAAQIRDIAGKMKALVDKGAIKKRDRGEEVWDWDLGMYIKQEDPKHPFESGRAYGWWLKKKGYESIGSGAYSTVFKHPKDAKGRCIKVSRRMDPWFEYIHWAYENGHTEFSPGVHSYKYHPGLSVDEKKRVPFYVAVVDELQCERSGKDAEHEMTGFFFQKLLHSSASEKTKMLAELNSPGFVAFVEGFAKRFKYAEDGKKRGDYSLDCYGGNTMLSYDGKRWVLNDPLCGSPKNDNIVKVRWRNDTRRSSSAGSADAHTQLRASVECTDANPGVDLANAA